MTRLILAAVFFGIVRQLLLWTDLTGWHGVAFAVCFVAAVASLHDLFVSPPRALARRFARATQ